MSSAAILGLRSHIPPIPFSGSAVERESLANTDFWSSSNPAGSRALKRRRLAAASELTARPSG